MPDLKPPRVNAGERQTLQALLHYQRDLLVRKMTGTDEVTARLPLAGSGTTLLWLVKQMTRAEILWTAARFAGQDVRVPDDAVHAGDTIPAIVSGYQTAWTQADSITAAAILDQPCKGSTGEVPVNLAGC